MQSVYRLHKTMKDVMGYNSTFIINKDFVTKKQINIKNEEVDVIFPSELPSKDWYDSVYIEYHISLKDPNIKYNQHKVLHNIDVTISSHSLVHVCKYTTTTLKTV